MPTSAETGAADIQFGVNRSAAKARTAAARQILDQLFLLIGRSRWWFYRVLSRAASRPDSDGLASFCSSGYPIGRLSKN